GCGLCGDLSARPTWIASNPISVRQVAVWLHADFRRRLATTPLRFASTSPPSGCEGDLHPQAVEHARHTSQPLARQDRGRLRPLLATPDRPFSSQICPALPPPKAPPRCVPPPLRRKDRARSRAPSSRVGQPRPTPALGPQPDKR